MRQIKFRGQKVDTKEWVYGYLIELWSPVNSERIFCIDCADKFDYDADSLNVFRIIPETVGQFTGLLDKNGKEIYEGDIVEFYKGYVDDSWTDQEQGKPYEIIWDSDYGYCGFKARRKNYSLVPIPDFRSKCPWEYEIIGNIHDNPEILKSK